MATMTVEVPEKLAEEIEEMVRAGWFSNAEEAVRLAIREFLQRHHLELTEQFQREDIAWALTQTRSNE
jgi:Arc/MetJ-type ribon-helix-helix transcriptional regulator